jgi:hypothetical protein
MPQGNHQQSHDHSDLCTNTPRDRLEDRQSHGSYHYSYFYLRGGRPTPIYPRQSLNDQFFHYLIEAVFDLDQMPSATQRHGVSREFSIGRGLQPGCLTGVSLRDRWNWLDLPQIRLIERGFRA